MDWTKEGAAVRLVVIYVCTTAICRAFFMTSWETAMTGASGVTLFVSAVFLRFSGVSAWLDHLSLPLGAAAPFLLDGGGWVWENDWRYLWFGASVCVATDIVVFLLCPSAKVE